MQKNFCSTLFFLVAGLFAHSATAQRVVNLVEESAEMAWFENKTYTVNAGAGDTLVFSVEAQKGKYLSHVRLLNAKGEELQHFRLPQKIVAHRVPMPKGGTLTLKIENTTIQPRSYVVQIQKVVPFIYKDTVITDTLVQFDTLRRTFYDTTAHPFPPQPFAMQASLNLPGQARHCIELPVILSPDRYAAWWIGTEAHYKQLSESPSRYMRLAEVSDPLSALGLALQPTMGQGIGLEALRYFLTDAEGAKRFMANGQAKALQRPARPYGLLRDAAFPGVYPLYICLENSSPASAVAASVRVVEFRIVKRVQTTVIEHIRTKETRKKIRVE